MLQCGLRTLQSGLRMLQSGLRTLQSGLRTLQCGLRTLQCGLRTAEAPCYLAMAVLSTTPRALLVTAPSEQVERTASSLKLIIAACAAWEVWLSMLAG